MLYLTGQQDQRVRKSVVLLLAGDAVGDRGESER